MIIEPRVRGFICLTAHPDGCAAHRRVDRLRPGVAHRRGLRLRHRHRGEFFERPASGRHTASAGWYNSAAFDRAATAAGRGARSINAFSSTAWSGAHCANMAPHAAQRYLPEHPAQAAVASSGPSSIRLSAGVISDFNVALLSRRHGRGLHGQLPHLVQSSRCLRLASTATVQSSNAASLPLTITAAETPRRPVRSVAGTRCRPPSTPATMTRFVPSPCTAAW